MNNQQERQKPDLPDSIDDRVPEERQPETEGTDNDAVLDDAVEPDPAQVNPLAPPVNIEGGA